MKNIAARPVAAPSHPRTHIPLGPLTLGEVVILWRLIKGGLAMSEAVKVAGVQGNTNAIAGIVNTFDMAMSDSLPLAGRVRCKKCGGRILSVPCLLCPPVNQKYAVSSYGNE